MRASFLFTDIVGSTQHWNTDSEAMMNALQAHDGLVRTAIARSGGRVFKHTGDGFAAAFSDVNHAIDAAESIQRELEALSFRSIDRLRVRVGVHTGTAFEQDGDLFGLDVNRTARLMSAAHGGQVLLSEAAASEVRDRQRLRPMGRHRLKDLHQPESIYQLDFEGMQDSFPPLRALPGSRTNLPFVTSEFVGREAEMSDLEKRISEHRLVTLTGAGGSGKTRLALHVAAEQIDHFPDGLWFVDFAPLGDDHDVARSVAAAMRLPETHDVDSILHHLEDRAALILLDNCEHVINGAARFVDRLLASTPSIRVLATSRERLDLPEEFAFALTPLPVPPKNASDQVLRENDAVRLFELRAFSAGQIDAGSTADLASIGEVVRLLDGIPLALELAAARSNAFRPSQLANLLSSRSELLARGRRVGPARHQTLDAVIEWSYDLLTPDERVVLRALSVFRGTADLDAVEAVCSSSVAGASVPQLVAQLVDKSMVVAESEGTATMRYSLLETIRRFAATRLEASDEVDVARTRHAHYFADVARGIAGTSLLGPDGGHRVREIALDLDNLRAALEFSSSTGDWDAALDLALGFAKHSTFLSRGIEASEWIELILQGADDGLGRLTRARALAALGTTSIAAGDVERAEDALREAARIFETAAGQDTDATSLNSYPATLNALAEVYTLTGRVRNEPTEYLAIVERLVAVARDLGDDYATAVGAMRLAEHWQHDLDVARDLYAEAEKAAGALGSPERLGTVRVRHASAEAAHGNYAEARTLWLLGAEQFAVSGDEPSRLTALALAATCSVLLGDGTAVDTFIEAAEQLMDVLEAEAPVHHPLIAIRAVIDAAIGAFDRVARAEGVSGMLDSMGRGLRADLAAPFSVAKQVARAVLPADDYEAAVDEGRSMTLTEVGRFILIAPESI